MNIIDLRKNLRASPINQRASGDRRQNPYPFGSPEWLEYIRNHGLECPAYDRRKMLRRASDRRVQTEHGRSEKPYTRILLTSAEKKLLVDMYLTDME